MTHLRLKSIILFFLIPKFLMTLIYRTANRILKVKTRIQTISIKLSKHAHNAKKRNIDKFSFVVVYKTFIREV